MVQIPNREKLQALREAHGTTDDSNIFEQFGEGLVEGVQEDPFVALALKSLGAIDGEVVVADSVSVRPANHDFNDVFQTALPVTVGLEHLPRNRLRLHFHSASTFSVKAMRAGGAFSGHPHQ